MECGSAATAAWAIHSASYSVLIEIRPRFCGTADKSVLSGTLRARTGSGSVFFRASISTALRSIGPTTISAPLTSAASSAASRLAVCDELSTRKISAERACGLSMWALDAARPLATMRAAARNGESSGGISMAMRSGRRDETGEAAEMLGASPAAVPKVSTACTMLGALKLPTTAPLKQAIRERRESGMNSLRNLWTDNALMLAAGLPDQNSRPRRSM